MTFQPSTSTELCIDETVYRFAEHPFAPGIAYGQEGRQATVYQLITEDGKKYALKVFNPRFRVPRMVAISETLEPYADLDGLQACQRIVLTGSRHTELLRSYPSLTYAVLMPWVEGPTWQDIVMTPEELSAERSLQIARSFANLMMTLEEQGLAHCDLSGPNLIIQPGVRMGLVDLEEMCGPGFLKPEGMPAGSPGYAHKNVLTGLWSSYADRFAGAMLLAEMLSWCAPKVRNASWGESYFTPEDLQSENRRLGVLRQSLEDLYGKRIPDLFNQAWRSDTLRDCPTFAEWAVALPNKIKRQERKEKAAPEEEPASA